MSASETRTIPTIGLSFIFRDDIVTVEAMLDSVLDVCDQVIAVDTGSTDGSRRVVKKKLKEWQIAGGGARSFTLTDFKGDGPPEWGHIDDFAAARQFGWKELTTDWGLWADADDLIDGAPALRQLTLEAPENIHAFIFDYDYAQTPSGVNVCTLRRERLIRDPQRWSWASPVHEVCIPSFPDANFALCQVPIWRHRKQPRENQGDRNLRIIEKHMADAAEKGIDPDPRMAVYHGTELAGRGRHEEALLAYDRYFAISGWGEEKGQAYHRKADSLRALGRHDEAIEADAFALTHAQDHGVVEWADHCFGIGESLIAKNQHHSAIAWFERGLAIGPPQSNLILNPRDYDWQPLINLATCHAALNDFDKALELSEKAWLVMQDENLAQRIRFWMAARQRDIAVKSALGLLESLIRYDENAKARAVLRQLPYVVLDDPRIQQISRHIRASLKHVSGREGYAELYATNRETRNPDDLVMNASEVLTRVSALAQGLREQRDERDALGGTNEPLRLLDAGCNDGWVGAHIEHVLHLADADGIDLNHEAIVAANERAKRLGLSGRFEEGFVEDAPEVFGEGVYDAIALFEVFEHLVDPHDSLDRLERALKPGGRVYVSTPIGAYENGLVENWQENWKKQHLRAVTPTEFASFALRRGFLHDMQMGREGVQVVSYEPQPRKGRIVFYAGQAWEPWSPLDLKKRGLGGSETAIVQMATALAADGWFVEVYGGLSVNGPNGQVNYRPWFEYDPDDPCDVFVSVRVPDIIDQQPKAFLKVLWLHDAHYGGQLRDRYDDYDEVLVLSHDHAEAISQAEGVPLEALSFTRNGVDLSRWPDATDGFDLREPTVIYSSSPDRGLENLLAMWPAIAERVPAARLKVFYGFDVFDRMHAMNPPMQEWRKLMVARMEELGVEFVGRVDQTRLAEEQQSARVWAYPYQFDNHTETSCITAMEAMAAGMAIVTTHSGALPETVGEAGVVLGKEEADSFADWVARLLTDKLAWETYHERGLARAQTLSWDDVAKEWGDRFETALGVKA